MKTRIKATDHKLTKKQRKSLITSSKQTLTDKHGWDKKAINRETGQKTETMMIDKENPLTVTKGDHLAFNVVRVTDRVFTKDHPNRIHKLTGEPIKKGDPVATSGAVAADSEDLEGFLEGHEREALHSPKVSYQQKQQIAKSAATREKSIVESETVTSKKPLRVQRIEEEERRRLAEEAREKKEEKEEYPPHKNWQKLLNKYPVEKDDEGNIITGLDYEGESSRFFVVKYYQNGKVVYIREVDKNAGGGEYIFEGYVTEIEETMLKEKIRYEERKRDEEERTKMKLEKVAYDLREKYPIELDEEGVVDSGVSYQEEGEFVIIDYYKDGKVIYSNRVEKESLTTYYSSEIFALFEKEIEEEKNEGKEKLLPEDYVENEVTGFTEEGINKARDDWSSGKQIGYLILLDGQIKENTNYMNRANVHPNDYKMFKKKRDTLREDRKVYVDGVIKPKSEEIRNKAREILHSNKNYFANNTYTFLDKENANFDDYEKMISKKNWSKSDVYHLNRIIKEGEYEMSLAEDVKEAKDDRKTIETQAYLIYVENGMAHPLAQLQVNKDFGNISEEEYEKEKVKINKQLKIQKILKARSQKEKEDGYTPEEREAIKLAIMERYPGLEEEEFDFRKGLSGMVDVRFNESGKFSTNGIWEAKLLKEGKELKANPAEPRLVEATIDDIDAEKASSAYHGTSFSPEQRGIGERRDYATHVNNFYDELFSKVPEDQRDELVAEMVKYKEFYKNGTEEQLHRHSGLFSSFISGPANFPVRQQQKKGEIYDRKRNEFSVKDAKVQRAIKKRLGLIKPRGISSDDPEAIKKIDAKITEVEKRHTRMKAANKLIRNKKTTDEEKKKQLKELGYDDSMISNLMNSGETYSNWEGQGYASFHLSGNTAEIRRLKKRKTNLEKQRSDTTSTTIMNEVEIEDNVEDNRLRILFDEKPDPETIRDLKSSGFRWSPRNSAWQRYRSSAANYEAERITKKYAERKNNKST